MSANPDPLTAYQGMQQTADLHENRIVRAIDPALRYLSANDAPMTRLLESTSLREDLPSSPFQWAIQNIYEIQLTATAAATAAANAVTATIAGTDWRQIRKNDLYKNESTGAVYMASATPSTSSVAFIVQYVPAGGSGDIAANDLLTSIGNAMHEGSMPRDPIFKSPAYERNLIQEFRNTMEISDRANAFTYVGENEYDVQFQKLYIKHQLDKEMALWSGVMTDATDGDGKRVTTTGGIEYFMRKADSRVNHLDLNNNPLTRAELNNLLAEMFQQGTSTERYMFCGRNAAGWFDSWMDDKLMITDQSLRNLGIFCNTYNTRYGTLHVIVHRLFNRIGWDHRAFLLDLEFLKLRALPGRGTTKVEDDTQPIGKHAKQTCIWDEWGLQVEALESQALIDNIAEPA